MSQELDDRVGQLTKSITDLATELRDKSDIPLDRIAAIEAEITSKSAQIDELVEQKRADDVDRKLQELDDRVKAYTRDTAQGKAAAILAGV